ncbi:hypothetical protein D3C76_154600 [compost metagenome]
MIARIKQWFIDRQDRKAVRELLEFKLPSVNDLKYLYGTRYPGYERRIRVNVSIHVLQWLLEELQEPGIPKTQHTVSLWLNDAIRLPQGLFYRLMDIGKSDSVFFEVVQLAVYLRELDLERVEQKLQGRRQLRIWESLRTNAPLEL